MSVVFCKMIFSDRSRTLIFFLNKNGGDYFWRKLIWSDDAKPNQMVPTIKQSGSNQKITVVRDLMIPNM